MLEDGERWSSRDEPSRRVEAAIRREAAWYSSARDSATVDIPAPLVDERPGCRLDD